MTVPRLTWDRARRVMTCGGRELVPTEGQRTLMQAITATPGALVKMREVEAAYAATGVWSLRDYRKHLRANMRRVLGDDSALVSVPRQGMRWTGAVIGPGVARLPWSEGAVLVIRYTAGGGLEAVKHAADGTETVAPLAETWPASGGYLHLECSAGSGRRARLWVGPERRQA